TYLRNDQPDELFGHFLPRVGIRAGRLAQRDRLLVGRKGSHAGLAHRQAALELVAPFRRQPSLAEKREDRRHLPAGEVRLLTSDIPRGPALGSSYGAWMPAGGRGFIRWRRKVFSRIMRRSAGS